MAQIFKGRVYNSTPYPSAEVNYEYTRDGANMKYHFWGKVYLESSGGWYYNNLRLKLYLNGSDVYTKDCKSSATGWSIDWDSGWLTVSNKTSGTTPFYFTVKDTQNSGWCNYTSGTYQLDVAPAYTSITGFSVSALSETSVRINWSAANTVDYVWYSTDNGSNWTGKDVTDGTSGSFDVGSLAANTSYNFKIRVRRKDSQLTTDSDKYTASTYAYPYLTSVPEFTVGNSLTIGIYNPLGRSCVISVIGDNGTEYTGGTITTTSISGFNNSTWLNSWYATLPNKTQGTYKARLKCTTGNINQLSSAVKYYLNTSDSGFKPTFTVDEIINIVNTANTAIAGSNKFIKNHNSLSGTIKPMTAQRSASGSYYNISASGLATVKKDYSSSNINFVLGNMSSNTFNVTAVDSRGFSTTRSKTIDLVDYNKPSVTSAKITRQNGIGTKAILAFSGKYTNWSGLLKTNAIQSIKYKIGSSGSWTALPSDATLTSSNGTWTLNAILTNDFAVTSQYDLYLQITDLLETVTTNAYTISTADAFVWKDLANKRIGIGKKPTCTFDSVGGIESDTYIQAPKIYNENNPGKSPHLFRSVIDLSALDDNTYYPVVGESIPYNGYHLIRESVQLNSGTKPSWATHNGGFTSVVEILANANGWGTAQTNTKILQNIYQWCTSQPVSYKELTNSSRPCFYCRGGGKYFLYTDYDCSWTIYTSSTTINNQTIQPESSLPSGDSEYRPYRMATIADIYPIGSIYLSATPTNPGTIFGGTWVQLKNHFLFATNDTSGNKGKDAVGTDSGTSTKAASGNTGASSGNTGSTTLTVNQIPAHSHGQNFISGDGNINAWVANKSGGSGGVYFYGQDAWYNSGKQRVSTDNTGGTQGHTHSLNSHTHSLNSHTHTVPYIEVYVWQRTA